jgi:hypothetical protein
MAIVEGSLSFRPNRCVRIASSYWADRSPRRSPLTSFRWYIRSQWGVRGRGVGRERSIGTRTGHCDDRHAIGRPERQQKPGQARSTRRVASGAQMRHDAYCIAAWLSRAGRRGRLATFLKPDLTPAERAVAQVEGWILGAPHEQPDEGDEKPRMAACPSLDQFRGAHERLRAWSDQA